MKKVSTIFLVIAIVFVLSIPAAFASGKNCSDFTSWEEAQKYFENMGGSKTNNVDGLDHDRDGFACETLPGFDEKQTTKPPVEEENPPSEEPNQPPQKDPTQESPKTDDKNPPKKPTETPKPKPQQPKEDQKPNPSKPKPEICEEPNPENFRDIQVNVKQTTPGKVTITAKIKGNQVSGKWYIAAGSVDSEVPEFEKEFAHVQGSIFTYELNIQQLKTGENVVVVGFEGTIDGKACSFGAGYAGLIVEDEDTVKPSPEEPKKPTPEKGKQDIEKLKGGKLPKTATSYPISIMYGLVLLLIGTGTLIVLRNRA